MTESHHDGALFVYRATIINGAAIATPTCTLTPGQGNEFQLLMGAISHDDATASTVTAALRDQDDNVLVPFIDALASVTADSINYFPAPGTAVATGGNVPDFPHGVFISGPMDLFLSATNIDATEGITVVIIGRVFGSVPGIVETAGGTPTITISTERTF